MGRDQELGMRAIKIHGMLHRLHRRVVPSSYPSRL